MKFHRHRQKLNEDPLGLDKNIIMEKTVQEWLFELPEDIRTKVMANCDDWSLHLNAVSVGDALSKAFLWEDSAEGYDYWNEIYQKYRNQ